MPTILQWVFTIISVFFLTGLINPKYLVSQLKVFKNIFKKPKIISITFFIDLLYYITMFLITTVFFLLIQNQAKDLQNLDMAGIKMNLLQEETQDQMAAAITSMQSFMIYLAVYLIIFIAIAFLIYTLFKGFIWQKISNSKPHSRFFLNFGLLNLVLLIVLMALIALFAYFTRYNFFTIFPYVLLVLAYFTYLATYLYTKTKNPFKSLAKAITLGITRFHLMIFPLAIIASLYVLIFALSFFTAKLGIALLTVFLYWFLLLMFFTIVRIYLNAVYSDLSLEK